MTGTLVDKIRSVGYWRFNLRPVAPPAADFQLGDALRDFREAAVRLRGWDFPHVPSESRDGRSGLEFYNNYVQGWTDAWIHSELWRAFDSSQFVYLKALQEDMRENGDVAGIGLADERSLSVLGAIFSVTEFFEFTNRLRLSSYYGGGVRASIQIGNSKGRALAVDGPGRMPFFQTRRTQAETVSTTVVIESNSLREPSDFAVDALIKIFDRFGWTPRREQIQAEVQSYYSQKW